MSSTNPTGQVYLVAFSDFAMSDFIAGLASRSICAEQDARGTHTIRLPELRRAASPELTQHCAAAPIAQGDPQPRSASLFTLRNTNGKMRFVGNGGPAPAILSTLSRLGTRT